MRDSERLYVHGRHSRIKSRDEEEGTPSKIWGTASAGDGIPRPKYLRRFFVCSGDSVGNSGGHEHDIETEAEQQAAEKSARKTS
jgi:hypothetical protein